MGKTTESLEEMIARLQKKEEDRQSPVKRAVKQRGFSRLSDEGVSRIRAAAEAKNEGKRHARTPVKLRKQGDPSGDYGVLTVPAWVMKDLALELGMLMQPEIVDGALVFHPVVASE